MDDAAPWLGFTWQVWLTLTVVVGVLLAFPVALSALCLYSHFGVTAEISEIRNAAFGPQGNLEAVQVARGGGSVFRVSGVPGFSGALS